MSKPKAYSYLRFSTPEQSKGDSFRRQRELAENYAATNGFDLDKELRFEDLGVSAYRGDNRDASLGAFLKAVGEGVIDRNCFLLVESLDRLSRTKARVALTQLSEIVDLGVTVVTLTDNKVYTSKSLDDDPTALLYSLLIMIRANEESETKARRLRSTWQKKRRSAQEDRELLTTRAPAWVAVEKGGFVVVENRAEVVRRIFDMTLEGMGKGRIAKTLNEEGVQTFGRSQGWHPSYIQKILDSEAVIGTFQPHRTTKDDTTGKTKRVPDGEPILNYFPAVVDRSTFLKARETRASRLVPRGKTGRRFSNIFSGLATCGECRAPMHFINKGSGWTYLQCSNARRKAGNCTNPSVRYDDVEAGVLLHGVEYIDFREVYPKTHDLLTQALRELEDRERTLRDDLQTTEQELENIADALGKRPDSATLLNRLDALERKQQAADAEHREVAAQVERERVRIANLSGDFESIAEALRQWTDEQAAADEDEAYKLRSRLNQLLKRVVDRVEIEQGGATVYFVEPKGSGVHSEPVDGYHIPQVSWAG